MKINIKDIPACGLDLEFRLSNDNLNQRVNGIRELADSQSVLPPEYLFEGEPTVSLNLATRGTTILLKGRSKAIVKSTCARCAEDVESTVEAKIDYVVKPRPSSGEIEEDLHYSYYDDEEIDCAVLAEENLVIKLPFSVFCTGEQAKKCGLTQAELKGKFEDEQPQGDERMAIFRTLKVSDNP